MALPSAMDVNSTEQLDSLFRTHYERIARVIGRVIHNQARAEELAVEVFLKWTRNQKAHGEHAEGWLYRTAVREALDELRRHTRRSRFEHLFHLFRASDPTPEHLYSANVEQQNVRAVLNTLDRRHAEVLVLWSEDLSYREMSAAMQVNPNYLGTLLSRAQDAFRKEYRRRYGDKS